MKLEDILDLVDFEVKSIDLNDFIRDHADYYGNVVYNIYDSIVYADDYKEVATISKKTLKLIEVFCLKQDWHNKVILDFKEIPEVVVDTMLAYERHEKAWWDWEESREKHEELQDWSEAEWDKFYEFEPQWEEREI